jgi:aldose 1-epimerase
VSTTATNVGEDACPYGSGQHPYLSPATGRIDDATIHLEGATRVATDDVRQLPTGNEPVEGTPYDFRSPRRLGDLAVDYAFCDLSRDGDGRAWVRVEGSDGRRAELWVDESYPYLEIYTGDTLAPDRRRTGLGVEPMTCPPNAFASGTDLVRLEPGQSATNTWGARLA